MSDLLDTELNEFALDFDEPLDEGVLFKPKMSREDFSRQLHQKGSSKSKANSFNSVSNKSAIIFYLL